MASRRRAVLYGCLLLSLSFRAFPAAGADADGPVETTICGIAENPQGFDGKKVRVKAIVRAGFETLGLADPDRQCAAICFAYPGGGPVASVTLGEKAPPARPRLVPKEDRRLREFREYLKAEMYPRTRDSGVCIACYRYQVTAVLTGRLDYAAEEGTGFGHLNQCRTQLVLESVNSLTAADNASKYDLRQFSTKPVRFPTGYVKGTLLASGGETMARAAVELVPVEEGSSGRGQFSVTDPQGHFKFEAAPGTYLLGVNIEVSPSPELPYPTLYHPDAADRAGAARIRLADRQRIEGLTLRLHPTRLRERQVRVRVLGPDGKPATDAHTWLAEAGRPRVAGGRLAYADADGRAVLTGFEGIDYFVHAARKAGSAEAPQCAAKVRVGATDTADPVEVVFTRYGEPCGK